MGFFLLAPALIWLYWYLGIVPITRFASTDRDRLVLYVMPVVAMIALLLVLFGGNTPLAQLPGRLLHPCFALALFFVGVGAWALPMFGLSHRLDVAERRNHGAGWTIGGAILGFSLAVGAAARKLLTNPALFEPLAAGLLGIAAFAMAWLILEWLNSFSETITVERDAGAALRLAALLPTLGASTGAAVSSWFAEQAIQAIGLHVGIVILMTACCVIERVVGKHPWPTTGPHGRDVLIALAYLEITGIVIFLHVISVAEPWISFLVDR